MVSGEVGGKGERCGEKVWNVSITVRLGNDNECAAEKCIPKNFKHFVTNLLHTEKSSK